MDAASQKFMIMVAVVVFSSVAGYLARRLGWLAEQRAGAITCLQACCRPLFGLL